MYGCNRKLTNFRIGLHLVPDSFDEGDQITVSIKVGWSFIIAQIVSFWSGFSHQWTNSPATSTISTMKSMLSNFNLPILLQSLGYLLPTINLLRDAATSVRQEFRDCSKWKRLRCRKVSIFSERDRGTVYVVHVGTSVEFDWTREGAVAFRPKSLDDNARFSDFAYQSADYDEEIVWQGEVLEVDERNGCLFICLDQDTKSER